jgi:SPP1 gp7 family putative phage head morphogenesis protein
MPDAPADAFLGERLIAEVRLARYEAKIAKAIERVLAALRARVMADVHGLTAAGWVDEPLVDPLLGQVVAAEVAPIVTDIYEEVAGVIFSKVGLDRASLPSAGFERQVARLTARVEDMGVDVARKVGRELAAGTQRGESVDDLAGRVRGAFDSSAYRARTIARTEVVSATNGASDDAAHVAHANGVPMRKQWLATRDSRTRPTHVAADGQTVAMDQEFSVGSSTLRYPGDPNGAAEEVVNCRCTTLYVPLDVPTDETPPPDETPAEDPTAARHRDAAAPEAPPTFRNHSQAAAWLRDRWSQVEGYVPSPKGAKVRSHMVGTGSRVVGLDGLNATQARFVVEALDQEFSHLPEVAARIPDVRTFRSAGYRRDAIGVASKDRFLYLRNTWFEDADKLNRESVLQHVRGWWSTYDTRGVIVHEFGHHVKYHVDSIIAARVARAEPVEYLAERIVATIGAEARSAEYFAAIRNGISKYAATNLDETAAEAWAEYRTMPNPRPLAKAIGEYFEEVIETERSRTT